jgi:hypothetical protein
LTDRYLDIFFLEITLLISAIDLIAFFLSSFLPLLDNIRVLLGFAILTYVLGASIRVFLKDFVRFSNMPSTLSIGGLACDLLLSLLANLTISSILARSFLFYGAYLVMAITVLVITLNSLTLLRLRRKQTLIAIGETVRIESKASLVVPLVIMLIASALFGVYFRNKTPFPTINGWDMNSALAYINWIIAHNGYNYLLIPSFPSGGTPYPALFFYLVSSYSLVLGVEPYLLYWFSIYPLIFGYMLLTFLIAIKLSRNLWLSIMSSFVAFFASTASAEIVRNPLYLTLDMMSLLVFLMIVVFNMYDHGRSWEKRIFNLLSAFALALFNYFTALAVFPFLVWGIIGDNQIPFIGDGRKTFRIATLGMALCAPILIALGGYAIPALTPLLSSSEVPISLKVELVQTIYPIYFWLLFGLALLSILITKKFFKADVSPYLDLLLYILCGFSVYFLPAWTTYRFEFYLRVFLAVSISSLGLLFDKEILTRIPSSPFKKLRNKRIHLGGIASFILLTITVAQMYPLFTQYNFYAYISKDEYDAAKWIRDNTPLTAYILTDPSSGYVIRGLTLRNASTYFILPDGRMPADSMTLYPNLNDQLITFLSSSTGLEWDDLMNLIKMKQVYVVITSRTVSWALSSSNVTITHPIDGMNYSLVTSKFVEPYFQDVYDSGTVKIYKPNPSLRVQEIDTWSDSNFTQGWSWYLDGSYGEHSYETNGSVLTLNAQARDSTSAFTGLSKEVNCSGATSLEIRSRIINTPYLLEAVLTDVTGATVRLCYLSREHPQSTWVVDRFSLNPSEADRTSKVSLIIWTKDTLKHTWEIDYITFAYLAFTTSSKP